MSAKDKRNKGIRRERESVCVCVCRGGGLGEGRRLQLQIGWPGKALVVSEI